ncbi:DNA methyltransferase [Lactobacillus delbrueckii]|nr:DNA methyltransferase [Lactobacillus delbrueckii]
MPLTSFPGACLRTCLVSAESGRIVENRLRSLSCQIIQAIFLERNLR